MYCVTHEIAVGQHSVGRILNVRDDGMGRKHTDPVKNMNLYHYMTFFSIFACISFITGLKSNLCNTLTTENTTESNFIVSHA